MNLQEKLKQLRTQIAAAEKAGDQDLIVELVKEYQNCIKNAEI